MALTQQVQGLVKQFRANEDAHRRGPAFKAVALAIEDSMRSAVVSRSDLLDCFGPPDLWDQGEGGAVFVYFFDHDEPGKDRDEWFFWLNAQTLYSSAYNERGVNDLSTLKPGSVFQSTEAQ